jgi:hypothetical protein
LIGHKFRKVFCNTYLNYYRMSLYDIIYIFYIKWRHAVEFTITCAISAYHHKGCEFESRSWRGALDATLCDKVWHCLATGLWFSPGTPVSSTNKTDCHDITEILLNGALSAITLTPIFSSVSFLFPVCFLFFVFCFCFSLCLVSLFFHVYST